jgi:HSP20 family protein
MARLLSSPGTLFDEFDRLQQEMGSLMASTFGPASIRAVAHGTFPALNVGVGPQSIDVYLLAPGVDPNTLDIALEDRVLTVSGTRPDPEESGRAYLKERFGGPFRRAVSLSEEVDVERVEAHYQHGVLHISLPRRGEARARRIEVKQ